MDVPGPLAAATDLVALATDEHAVVAMRASDACMHLEAGDSVGAGAVAVNVTFLKIASPVEVQFPAEYMAGTTNGHAAEPSCNAE